MSGATEPNPARLDLVVEVVAGRRSLDDPAVRAACAEDPSLAAALRGALAVAGELDAMRAQVPDPDPRAEALAAIAVRTAREGLALPPVAPRPGRRRLLVLAGAAVVLGAVAWAIAGGAFPRGGSTHLRTAVQLRFAGSELVVAPAPSDGQHYEIEFLVGDRVVSSRTLRGSDRMVVPDLRGAGEPLHVRARLVQGGEESARSDTIAVPPGVGR